MQTRRSSQPRTAQTPLLHSHKQTQKPTIIKPATRMISYQNPTIIDKDEETALLLGTTILPQPTNNSDDHELPSVVESCYCCRYGDDACGGRWHGLVQGCVVSWIQYRWMQTTQPCWQFITTITTGPSGRRLAWFWMSRDGDESVLLLKYCLWTSYYHHHRD